MKKVIGYIRVSTGEQQNSIANQRSKIEAFSALNNLDLIDVIVDEDVSGKVKFEERIGGRKALDYLYNGTAKQIISTTLDRMFRSSLDGMIVTNEWSEKGIDFTFINMGGMILDSSTPMGKMMLTLTMAFAELERNMIADRIKTVSRYKKSNLQVYGRTPYGFNAVDGMLVPNTEEMNVVCMIKQLAEKGKSLRYIADSLNANGFTPKEGGEWGHTSINKILKNNIYNNELCHE